MHELSVCLALIGEVERVAFAAEATAVWSVTVRVGPLSGVEPGLLKRAFAVARIGTIAQSAELNVDLAPVRIRCLACGAEGEVAVNRLLCAHCGGYRARVIEGEELILSAIEMDVTDYDRPAVKNARQSQVIGAGLSDSKKGDSHV